MKILRRSIPWIVSLALLVFLLTKVDSWLVWNALTPTLNEVARKNFALERKVAGINTRLRGLIIADSIKQFVPSTPGIFVGSLDHDPKDLDRLQHKAKGEVGGTPLTAVGIVATPDSFGDIARVSDFGGRQTFFAGKQHNVDYCAVAPRVWDTRWGKDHRTRYFQGEDGSEILGPCRFFARYGTPSSAIMDWLRLGNHRFAFDPYDYFYARERSDLPLLRGFYDTPIAFRACAAGRRAACTNAFTHGPNGDGSSWYADLWGGGVLPSQPIVLRRLETRFGADRFTRFWKSDQDVETAFASAFGMPVGEWVYSQTARYRDRIHATPRMSLETIVLTAVIVALLIALTAATAQRRVV